MRHTFTTTDGTKFEFICETWSTRSAWGHECKLYEGDSYEPVSRARVRYYNRTWEAYQYQSVMMGAVYSLIRERRADLVQAWKDAHGRKRATEAQKADAVRGDKYLERLDNLMNLIRAH